jgi:hypothetical protein
MRGNWVEIFVNGKTVAVVLRQPSVGPEFQPPAGFLEETEKDRKKAY